MIEIRCHNCHKLNAEVSRETIGFLQMKCKKCNKWIKVVLSGGSAGARAQGPSVENKVAAAA